VQFPKLTDIALLREAIDTVNAQGGNTKLVIFDTLDSYLDGRDSNNSADVKEILAPVVKLAAELHIAILGLMHLNKATGAKAINRISGSMAFPGLSRCSWVFAKDSREPGRRLMLPVKINIGPDESGIEYSIESDHGVPFIKWGQSCTEDVDSILSGVSPREEGKHAPAQEAVLRVLRDVGGNMKLSGLAQVLGKSTPTISNLLRKLEASGEVQPGAEYGSWRLANSAT